MKILFCKCKILESRQCGEIVESRQCGEIVEQIWKRRAPENDADPFDKLLNILDMQSISTRDMQ